MLKSTERHEEAKWQNLQLLVGYVYQEMRLFDTISAARIFDLGFPVLFRR